MQPKLFTRFEDVEAEVAEKAPPILYKYRKWSDPYHQELLRKGEVYFAHPFGLNDPLDIRPEIIFNLAELDRPEYLEKMIATAGMPTEYANRIRAENHLALMKADPTILLQNAKEWNENPLNFDQIGVFSTATTPINVQLWKEYSNNNTGFAIGFKALELCREMKCGFGYMHYSDEPIIYHFLDKSEDDPDMLYYKKDIWRLEDEFRFVTVGVGKYVERAQFCSVKAFSDVTLGYNITEEDEKEIKQVLIDKFAGNLPLYKTVMNGEGILDRKKMDY